MVDLTLSSDTEHYTPHLSDTSSSGSSFNVEDFVSDLVHRRRTSVSKPTAQPLSENRISVPPSFLTSYSTPSPSPPTLPITQKKPIVGKMLRNFEYEMKKWIISLNESCSESYDPTEAQQLFSQFRKKFSNAAATIQDVACKNAWNNLLKKINTRVLYLKDVPECEAYTDFADRYAAAKAAQKARLDADMLKAEMRLAEFSKKAAADAEMEQASDSVAEMDVDEVQRTIVEENAAEEKDKVVQTEDSVDMKAWMANQERVTSDLQKTTEDLQKSNEEIKSWMVQQSESSSKIENLLTQLLAKQS